MRLHGPRNVLKLNDEELVTVSRIFGYPGIDLREKCWILLAKYNLKMLILTCGTNGSYLFTSAILNGKPVPEAHKLAVEVSAYVCTQSGAMPELPEGFKERMK